MSVPRRSEALQTDARLRAARFPAGKSLRLFWPQKEPDIRLHLLLEKFPAAIYLFVCVCFFKINNLKSLGDFFGEGEIRLSARFASEPAGLSFE